MLLLVFWLDPAPTPAPDNKHKDTWLPGYQRLTTRVGSAERSGSELRTEPGHTGTGSGLGLVQEKGSKVEDRLLQRRGVQLDTGLSPEPSARPEQVPRWSPEEQDLPAQRVPWTWTNSNPDLQTGHTQVLPLPPDPFPQVCT